MVVRRAQPTEDVEGRLSPMPERPKHKRHTHRHVPFVNKNWEAETIAAIERDAALAATAAMEAVLSDGRSATEAAEA